MLRRKGNVVAKTMKDTSKREITPRILEYIKRSATLYTDEWKGYNDVSKLYDHFSVDHSKGQYSDGNITTNTIEGFWSLIKRGYVGIYHYMSDKHLQMYIDEFVFRYNTRKMSEHERFNRVLSVTHAYCMTYNDLIAA